MFPYVGNIGMTCHQLLKNNPKTFLSIPQGATGRRLDRGFVKYVASIKYRFNYRLALPSSGGKSTSEHVPQDDRLH
jgi:hypothetical protein